MKTQHKLRTQVRTWLWLPAVLGIVAAVFADQLIISWFGLEGAVRLLVLICIAAPGAFLIAHIAAVMALKPLNHVTQAIAHVDPENPGTPAPDLDKIVIGRDIVSHLCLQIDELASTAGAVAPEPETVGENLTATIARSMPLPLFVIDSSQSISFANDAALNYLQTSREDLFGKNVYSKLDLMFSSDDTLDNWLADCREHKVTAQRTWERVRLSQPEGRQPKQFDLAAFYNKDNPAGAEIILTLFDHTARYSQDDDGISFMALAVHELRTPLTLLRGYIEVFEDEFEGKLDEELAGFMHKMQASAQSLSSFVSNILNVARVEQDQLLLKLAEEKWDDIVRTAGESMQLRAQVHQKQLRFDIAPDLPTVAVDRVSISEVLYNLLDNAIKYGGDSPDILIRVRQNQAGQIETSVQDYGIGINSSAVSSLFEKFYRNHRSREQVGGSGLGLYLCKAIVNAHDGNIWVDSKEGEGSTFTFTVQPYATLAQEAKSGDNGAAVTRGAHGWIKNHSLYRR